MPSVTQPLAKKRRRDECEPGDDNIHFAFPDDFHDYYAHPHQHHGASPRKVASISSPLSKKIRMSSEENTLQRPLAPSSRHNHTRTPSATSKQQHPHNQQQQPSLAKITNVLSPCHICHRKPTKKTELDSYADCEGCGERTCYVCIRACLGWKGSTEYNQMDGADDDDDDEILMKDQESEEDEGEQENRNDQSLNMEDAPTTEDDKSRDEAGQGHTKKFGGTWGEGGGRGHRARICSQCCVEEGLEGDVICLGCLESQRGL